MSYIHIALNLRDFDPAGKVILGRKFIKDMSLPNTNFVAPNPLPNPTLAIYKDKCDNLNDAIVASGKGKLSTEDLHIAIDDFDINTNALKVYVEGIANTPGNTEAQARAIIVSAGMTVSEHGAPITTMEKPVKFHLDFGENEGEIHAFMNAIHGTKGLILEISLDGVTWGVIPSVVFASTKDMIVTGLTSGQKYYMRIHAIGAHTQSPVSDIISQRAR
jgi:hypothetical protein